MTFKEGAIITTDNFWYDLMEGSIELKEVLAKKEELKQVNDAIRTLQTLFSELESAEILELF